MGDERICAMELQRVLAPRPIKSLFYMVLCPLKLDLNFFTWYFMLFNESGAEGKVALLAAILSLSLILLTQEVSFVMPVVTAYRPKTAIPHVFST